MIQLLYEVILDEVQIEYIANLIAADVVKTRHAGDTKMAQVKEDVLNDLRYFHRHRIIGGTDEETKTEKI